MAFDKHRATAKQVHETKHADKKNEKRKKPFGEGSNSDKGRNLDAYDKEQKLDKELGEKKPEN